MFSREFFLSSFFVCTKKDTASFISASRRQREKKDQESDEKPWKNFQYDFSITPRVSNGASEALRKARARAHARIIMTKLPTGDFTNTRARAFRLEPAERV